MTITTSFYARPETIKKSIELALRRKERQSLISKMYDALAISKSRLEEAKKNG